MSNTEDIDVYKVLARQNTSFYSDRPKTFYPSPETTDYSIGYITRCFSRKTNDKNASITEISEHTASLFKENPFYLIVSVKWKITGSLNTINKNGIEYEEGVSEHNFRTTSLAEEKMMGISQKLSDPFKFYKK